MNRSLNVVLADDDRVIVEELTAHLHDMGHKVAGTATSGHELLDLFQRHHPDMVIVDIVMPDMDGLEAVEKIQEIRKTPVLVISAYDKQDYIRRALDTSVMCYQVKPVSKENLRMSIEFALQRFQDIETLREEAFALKQRLLERKRIERAKGILMLRAGLTESEAHRRLQDMASVKNRKLIEIANSIIDADDVMRPNQ